MIISTANLNKSEDTYKTNSINIKSNLSKVENKEADKVLENASISSVEKTGSPKVDSKGYASLIEDVNSVTEELKNSAQTAKASLKALFNKMSGADCVQMDEDGFNLNDMSTDEVVTVVDRIKIMLATYCEDYKETGDSIDISKIKQVVGSTAMANQVSDKLKNADLPDTKDNIDEVNNAAKQAEEIKPLSEQAKNYLVSNRLAPSIQNIYKAEHASIKTEDCNSSYQSTVETMGADEWSQLKPQVEAVINKAGLNIDEKNLNNAKSFIENNIPVTEKNLVYKNELDSLDLSEMNIEDNKAKVLDKIISNMTLGNSAGSTLVTDAKNTLQMVSGAIKTVNSVDMNEIVMVTNQGDELTVENLRAAQASTQETTESEVQNQVQSGVQSEVVNQDSQSIANYRKLEEIRILMTADAGLSLAKQGFNLDTTPIADLVEQLKTMEAQLYGDDSNQVIEVKNAMYEIKTSPDVMIGAVMAENSVINGLTIADFSQMGSNLKQRFKQAGQTYESVGTQVRNDLGDSVNKAIDSSTQSLLTDLGLEDTKANRDAIRILGYNKMEISVENVSTVKEIYSTLSSMIDNMKPETVLSMIRSNINPMKADINDVNQYLINENEGADSTDKFSKFLYKLDRTDGITSEEREQFIGIYKMMNIFKKDAGKAVGTLVKQNEDVTMSNLIKAYNSSKAAGIDFSIDDTVGMAEVMGTVNYYNNLFSETAECITPKSLKTVNSEKAIDTRSVENFCESINEVYDSEVESKYYEEYLKDVNKVADIENSVVRQLTDNDMQVTINNIMALQNIMTPNYFQKYLKLDNKKNSSGDNQNNEISDYLNGFIDKLGSDTEISEAYQKMADIVESTAQDALNSSETQTYSNIEELRMMGKEIGIIKNLGQKHDYKIPLVVDGEVGTINLQIIEDSDDKGKIAIKLETNELGNVSIECKLSSENASIFAITDGDKSVLSDRINSVTNQMVTNLGIEKVGVYVGKSNEIPDVNYNTDRSKISMKKLYDFAKILIVSMVKPDK